MTTARRRMDRPLSVAGARSAPEVGVLVLVAIWSLLPLAILFAHGSGGRVFTGADFPDVIDQLQYMAWVRDVGEHLLISNASTSSPIPTCSCIVEVRAPPSRSGQHSDIDLDVRGSGFTR